ncbi:MFS monocarboxylate transporter [Hypoxylon trugodes]|uniref:MFS monocarboxylate transporter n=1 Tax=Hypoxylon trugodes TaxID=326681 RepID=UPI00219CEC1E|nr:MFS monocarboxylate transporter [Hypoxylon trugodes]KAI1384751.1 MFS monocarboxylate transporter [Hypoxylon trugodes]
MASREAILIQEPDSELTDFGHTGEDLRRTSVHAYPEPDRGKHAWLFLWVGCFLMVAITWGFPFSYGVFQSYYSTHPPFSDQPEGLPAVGTTTLGILYLTSPPSFIILQRYQSYRRSALIAGSVITCLAILTSAFATKIWHLILTQGILYGLGASVVNTVTLQFLNEWFIERKGLAFGIQESGAGMGGIVIPVLMTWGLEKYGHRTMLIAWFVAVAILSLPSIYFLRPRLRPRDTSAFELGGLNCIATPIFALLQAGNIFQAFGNFLPGIHLPSFAQRFGASSLDAAGMLSLYNAATVIGAICTGYLVDRCHVSVALLLLSLGAASAVFFAWGFAADFATLCGFAFLYGIFAGGWSSTWVGISLEIQKRSPRADLGVLWGFAAAARGVGSIASGPISEKLIAGGAARTVWWPRSYGTSYGILILFDGAMLTLGGIGCAARAYEIWKKIGHRHND